MFQNHRNHAEGGQTGRCQTGGIFMVSIFDSSTGVTTLINRDDQTKLILTNAQKRFYGLTLGHYDTFFEDKDSQAESEQPFLLFGQQRVCGPFLLIKQGARQPFAAAPRLSD